MPITQKLLDELLKEYEKPEDLLGDESRLAILFEERVPINGFGTDSFTQII